MAALTACKYSSHIANITEKVNYSHCTTQEFNIIGNHSFQVQMKKQSTSFIVLCSCLMMSGHSYYIENNSEMYQDV